MSGRTLKESAALRCCLRQAGWAVSTKRDNYLSALYRRLAARRGGTQAVITVAHSILVMAFHMLTREEDCSDTGADYFDRPNTDGL